MWDMEVGKSVQGRVLISQGIVWGFSLRSGLVPASFEALILAYPKQSGKTQTPTRMDSDM